MGNDLAVEAAGLEKSYGKVRVLTGVDLRVPRGSIFALLGPNGAGKTTTVRILATLTTADAGRATVAGYDIVRDRRLLRRSISLTGQYAAVDGMQTGEENLRMMARLSGQRRAAAGRRARELLEQFGLADAAGRRVATYSGGMRRRLDLAASLTGQPGRGVSRRADHRPGPAQPSVDVAGHRRALRRRRDRVPHHSVPGGSRPAGRPASPSWTTGGVVAEGTPAELKQQVADQRLDLMLAGPSFFAGLARQLGARAIHLDQDTLTIGVATDGSAAQVRALLDEIDPQGAAVQRFAVHTATLDDVFLALTGHAATTAEQQGGRQEKETVSV